MKISPRNHPERSENFIRCFEKSHLPFPGDCFLPSWPFPNSLWTLALCLSAYQVNSVTVVPNMVPQDFDESSVNGIFRQFARSVMPLQDKWKIPGNWGHENKMLVIQKGKCTSLYCPGIHISEVKLTLITTVMHEWNPPPKKMKLNDMKIYFSFHCIALSQCLLTQYGASYLLFCSRPFREHICFSKQSVTRRHLRSACLKLNVQ